MESETVDILYDIFDQALWDRVKEGSPSKDKLEETAVSLDELYMLVGNDEVLFILCALQMIARMVPEEEWLDNGIMDSIIEQVRTVNDKVMDIVLGILTKVAVVLTPGEGTIEQ